MKKKVSFAIPLFSMAYGYQLKKKSFLVKKELVIVGELLDSPSIGSEKAAIIVKTLEQLFTSLERIASIKADMQSIKKQMSFASRRGDIDELGKLVSQYYDMESQLERIKGL